MDSNKTEEFKYVWLNLNNGEFSQSWGGNVQSDLNLAERFLNDANMRHWKLIKYTCINDKDFDFYDRMKIMTKTKNILERR